MSTGSTGGGPGGLPGGMPGFPGMAGFPGLSMEALQQFMQDPNIQRMTQAIAQDPVFLEMAKEMQEAMLSQGMGGMNLNGEDAGEATEGAAPRAAPAAAAGMPGMPGMPPMPGMPGIDPSKYMEAMQRVMQNPEFLSAAEQLGRGLMSQVADPEMLTMMELFSNPENQALLKSKMEEMKDDPELKEVMEDIEKNGQGAMMKYMQDEEVMSKLGRKFQEAMKDPQLQARLKSSAAAEGEQEEEEEPTVLSLASEGDVEGLKKLLAGEGVDVNERDDEGRSALHFASGYNELECMKVLLEAGADVNAVDANENTSLHYAAGYGNQEAAKLLLEKGADKAIKNAEGKTAGEVAEMNEQAAVVELLKA
ncbi:hypothetical protein ABPG77_004261 [Micractinium sp. CCAP 211/92]